tara:strand:- start:389 stop:688 length:300 start_codon:yes stop_codon:yes gene_type:complete
MKKASDFIHQEDTLPAGERHNQIRLTLPTGKVISIVQGDSTQRAHGVHGEAKQGTVEIAIVDGDKIDVIGNYINYKQLAIILNRIAIQGGEYEETRNDV